MVFLEFGDRETKNYDSLVSICESLTKISIRFSVENLLKRYLCSYSDCSLKNIAAKVRTQLGNTYVLISSIKLGLNSDRN